MHVYALLISGQVFPGAEALEHELLIECTNDVSFLFHFVFSVQQIQIWCVHVGGSVLCHDYSNHKADVLEFSIHSYEQTTGVSGLL